MQLLLKITILFSITGLLFPLNTYSQISQKKKPHRNEIFIAIPKAPTIVDTNNNPNIDLSSAIRIDQNPDLENYPAPFGKLKESTESILKFFINERKDTKYFTFIDRKDTATFQLSNILNKHIALVNAFIFRYKNQKYNNQEEFNAPQLKSIADKINKLYQVYYKKRNKKDVDNIFSLINEINYSKEKVALYLNCADLDIHNETYYNEISEFCNVAKNYASKIKNLYKQAEAYTLIGDFAVKYQIPYSAIQMYYLARESISNSSLSEKQKNQEQGYLCDKLGGVFYSLELMQSSEKAGEYYNNAIRYYEKAEDYNNADIDKMFTVDIATGLWANYWQYYPNDINIESQNQVLNILKFWFKDRYARSSGSNNDISYLGLYSIAENLYSINKQVALIYFIEALPYALFGSNLEHIIFGLDNVSRSLAANGNKDLSLKYANLEVLINDSLHNNFMYDKSLLNKASNYLQLKNYDSALIYSNNFISDTAKMNYYYPTYYDKLLEEAFRVKYISLDSLNNHDSARVYERRYVGYQTQHFQNLVDLIYIDYKSASEWSERSRDKAFAIQKELAISLNNNLILKQALLDSTKKLALKNEILALVSDSLRVKDSVSSVKGLQQEKNNTAEQKKLKEQQESINKQQKIVWGVGSLIALALLGSFFYYFKKNNKFKLEKAQDAKRKKEIELKQLDELARNKIHNIQNDYHALPNMLYLGEIDKAKVYTAEYGAYLATFFENWKKEKITLSDELTLLKQYCKVKQALGKRIIFDETNVCININPKTTRFIQSVFDTLLDNSVRRGFKDKQDDCYFNVRIERKGELLFCDVQDNGIPPSNPDSYFRRKDSGLNTLKSRVKGMFELRGIPVPVDFFIAESLENKGGTIVKIIMPYEEQII